MRGAAQAFRRTGIGRRWGLWALIGYYLLVVILIRPVGEFPLNDDWSYAWAVRHFLQTGDLVFTGWNAITLVFQVLWGSLFAAVFGFSHFVLRLSTLTLSLVGALAVYALARDLEASESIAVLAGFSLAANPLYLLLSCTFMTDVTFTALLALSLWLYARGAAREQLLPLALGGVAAAAGVLTRQPGGLLPLGAAVSLLVMRPRRLGRALTASLAAPAVGIALSVYAARAIPNFQPGQPNLTDLTPDLLWRLFWDLATLGFLAAPLALVVLFVRPWRGRERRWLLGAGAVFGAGGLFLGLHHLLMPYLPNMLTPYGAFDPRQLLAGRPPVVTPLWGQILMTVVALAGAAALAGALMARPPENEAIRRRLRTALIIGGVQLGFVLLLYAATTRYLLAVLPTAIALCVVALPRERARRALVAGCLILLAFATYGVVITRDLFAWNRVKWGLAEELVAQGVPAGHIEGGFEWDAWHHPMPVHQGPPQPIGPWDLPWYTRELLPDVVPDYVISFSPLPGYDVIRREPYPSLLGPPEQRFLYVLRRQIVASAGLSLERS